MASRLLRADLQRIFRPCRAPRNTSSNALLSAVSVREYLSAQPLRTHLAGAKARHFTPGWHSKRNFLPGRECSAFAAPPGGGFDVCGRAGATNSRLGSVQSVVTSAACWRRREGVVPCLRHLNQPGRRHMATRKAKASGPTLMNNGILAKEVLLVFETKDGGKETTRVPIQRARAAAEAANLDLVQVTPASVTPVVCRLMDFKREEYRKQKMKKASAKRPQKRKEIHLRGMIAKHDYERKMNDVKRYLERGDFVKVVLEANTSLLKRAGNCLNELQESFEAEIGEMEGVTLKYSGGGNGYTRREIQCVPKSAKAGTPAVGQSPAPAGDAAPTGVPLQSGGVGAVDNAATGGEEMPRPSPPPPRRVIDAEIVREILSGKAVTGKEKKRPNSSDESSEEHCVGGGWEGDSSSSEEESDFDAAAEGEEQKEGKRAPLKLGDTVIAAEDLGIYNSMAEDAAKAEEMEWAVMQARKRDFQRKQKEAMAKEKQRAGKSRVKRGGSGGRKSRRFEDDDDDDFGGHGGGRGARHRGGSWLSHWSEDDFGIDDNEEARSPGARKRRWGDEENFAGKGGPTGDRGGRDSKEWGAGSGRGGAGAGGRHGSRREGGGRIHVDGGAAGRGGGGRGLDPLSSPPVTTPYRWRTSTQDENGGTAAAAAAATVAGATVQRQMFAWRKSSQSAVVSAPAAGPVPGSWVAARIAGGQAAAAATAAGEDRPGGGGGVKGFRARFGTDVCPGVGAKQPRGFPGGSTAAPEEEVVHPASDSSWFANRKR